MTDACHDPSRANSNLNRTRARAGQDRKATLTGLSDLLYRGLFLHSRTETRNVIVTRIALITQNMQTA